MNKKKSMQANVKVTLKTFDLKILKDGQVSLVSENLNGGGDIKLTYDESISMYIAKSVPKGSYTLTASAESYMTESRRVFVDSEELMVTFIPEEEGMPFYYRGRVRVPFKPTGLIGVALNRIPFDGDEREHKEKEQVETVRSLAIELGLTEFIETPEAIKQEKVRIFEMKPDLDDADHETILERLSGHRAVRNAGLVIKLDKHATSILTRQLIVRFKSQVSPSQIRAIVEQNKLNNIRRIPYAGKNVWLLEAKDEQASYRILEKSIELAKLDNVEYVEPNFIMTAVDLQAVPTDYLYLEQWHIPLVNLPQAWEELRDRTTLDGITPGNSGDLTYGGENVVIAVLDRGIQSNHPDFNGTVTSGDTKYHNSLTFIIWL
ncbi:MAG: hypothetical protein IPM55_15365 [Acidobacteria bacterium]|nr:hypothetical protein [Acidobacteriota bacterium]